MADRYKNIELSQTSNNTRYRRNVIYPTLVADVNDIYITTTIGDRYDNLALQFYNDPSLWWIIASANNFEKSSLNVRPGVQLRIPANKAAAIQLFENTNKIR